MPEIAKTSLYGILILIAFSFIATFYFIKIRAAYYYSLIMFRKVKLVEITDAPKASRKIPKSAKIYSLFKWGKDTGIVLLASGTDVLSHGRGWAVYKNGKQFNPIAGLPGKGMYGRTPHYDLERVIAHVLAENQWNDT